MAGSQVNTARRLEPEPRNQGRAWATAIPYEEMDQDEDIFPQQAPVRGPHAPTQPLRAVPTRHQEAAARPARVENVQPAPAAQTTPMRQAAPTPAVAVNAGTLRLIAIGAGALVAVMALYFVVSTVVHWTQIKMDDLAYGRPRTTHLEAVVGHNDSLEQPTNFIGLNLNRQVTIFEIPGGDTGKASVINGPYLFGEGEDLAPVHLNTVDVNNDGKLDLLVTVKEEQLVFINDNGSFRAMTADEKTQLAQPAQGGGPVQK